MTEVDAGWGDQLRQMAAEAARLADEQDEMTATLREIERELPHDAAERHGLRDPGEMIREVTAQAYRLRTQQRLNAQVAHEFDAMVSAGGPSNELALARYREAVRLATDLMRTDFEDFDLGT